MVAFEPLSEKYFYKDTLALARSLLGRILVHCSPEGITSGIIVETEAYLSKGDPACHAARGKTKRNAAMFGPPGRAYIYFIYGMHYCFNVVSNAVGIGEAVLIRALEPVGGLSLMEKRRKKNRPLFNLTNGPGKLCAAMGIDRRLNGLPLFLSPLYLTEGIAVDVNLIKSSGRIGINQAKDKPWRFFIEGNLFVSRR
ncbi:MAG TPA: DNA-3-methyladenine glycosylase [Firmicutes bacterium]|nr:DNA-3-methyladenine glycosylase [Bacillota bacterium]